ncbi:RecF/RecN/SMC N terminal domain-containing protein [Besnoitia besnoiti]|uniref:RecF/RecN/SMC N terminal domain-containing protein n=1 Tax=Besnoitia besnoiti TaxID=94643 RepID=A0A2A9MAV7_BESBE|nr:RecF/RecN/SMC N terminal domain-containing protein [Besnoitia besnoiti]PFH32510.1 RecF/RecN/SMC N terminal domain-containing protein [Besnoitia besnoiti]
MHIKEVTIRGFRTYRHATTIRFSPRYNCIVGSNGSGKSNVLLAIAFALGEGGHSPAERRMLLHEGVSERVAEGAVELVLANQDRRLCMYDADEVQIRRVFSATTDDSFVQGKRVSKSGLQQLLECAGFARGRAGAATSLTATSTAYFIQQGRIVQVALQSSAERLALLQHVALGASFDAKTQEIETLLRVGACEADRVRAQVKEIGDKFDEMAAERGELKACLELEEEKEKIDFVLAEAAWREAAACLEASGRASADQTLRIEELEERLDAAQSLREELEKQLEVLKAQQARQTALRDEAAHTQAELRAEEEKLRLEAERWERREVAEERGDDRRESELKALKARLHDLEKGIEEDLRPSLHGTLTKYQTAQQKLQQAQQQCTALQCRRGLLASRAAEAETKPREDAKKRKGAKPLKQGEGGAGKAFVCSEAEVQREIKQAEHLGKEETQMLKTFTAKIEALRNERAELEREREASELDHGKALEQLRETETAQVELGKAFEAALEELRVQQAQLGDLLQEHTATKDTLETCKDRFWSHFRTDVRDGLQAAIAFAREKRWLAKSLGDSEKAVHGAKPDASSATDRNECDGGSENPQAGDGLPRPAAGMLLDFIDVASEYRRAVEATGGHALTAFLVPDGRAAAELLAFLKTRRSHSASSFLGRGASRGSEREGSELREGKPNVSITVVPLEEVAALQRQKEETGKHKARHRWIQTLTEEGRCMPLAECIDVQVPGAGAEIDKETSTASKVSAYLRSVFGRAMLVPSLAESDDGLIPSLHEKGLDCVTVDGDVAFASGIVRGGSALTPFLALSGSLGEEKVACAALPQPASCGKLQAYRHLQQRMEQLDALERQIEETRKRAAEVENRHGAFIEKEQLLCEARARCHGALDEAVTTRQHAESRLRATAELLAAVEEEARQATQRAHGLKTLIQNLRKESISPDNAAGFSTEEKSELARLRAEIRELERELTSLAAETEKKERAVQQAMDEADLHLRKQIQRLEREEARRSRSEAHEKRQEMEERLAAVNRRMIQEEEASRKSERRLRVLEQEVEEKEGELALAEKQRQAIVVQVEDALRALQMSKRAADSAERAKDDAEALLATTGAAAAAASDVPSLRLLSSRELAAKLSAVKKKLEAYAHVNRRAVDQFANLQDDYAALQQRASVQERAQEVIGEQLRVLVKRKKKALLASFARVNEEFQRIFATLAPGARAEMVLQHSLLPGGGRGCFEDDKAGKGSSSRGDASRAKPQPERRPGGPSGGAAESSENFNQDGEESGEDDNASSLIGIDIRASFSEASLADPAAAGARQGSPPLRLALLPGDSERRDWKKGPGGEGRTLGMNHLSGGQKSLVSLALLLALQRVSCGLSSPSEADAVRDLPGGVLLLDEVDAALDENHRRAAALALAQTAERRISQVILTTFRPELLSPADSLLHVHQENRVSYAEPIDLRAAVALLQEPQGDEVTFGDEARKQLRGRSEGAEHEWAPLAAPAPLAY